MDGDGKMFILLVKPREYCDDLRLAALEKEEDDEEKLLYLNIYTFLWYFYECHEKGGKRIADGVENPFQPCFDLWTLFCLKCDLNVG